MNSHCVTALNCIAMLLLLPSSSKATDPGKFHFFESRIRPVLIKHCYGCHSSAAKPVRANYLLDTKSGIRKGGASKRDAIVPGDSEASYLIEAIRYSNKDLKMPPAGKLPENVIADIEKWVNMGAHDSRDGTATKNVRGKEYKHWAWKRPVRARPPHVNDTTWPVDPIDNFVLAKLNANGFQPNPDADRATLIRRATIELIGLPPTVAEIDSFLKDPADDRTAFGKVIDRLLDNPGFGVRWGRHWLDVARFGESSGYSRNMLYPYAWRYRNYVIDSFNSNKPFNQFIREQIAGDLLPARDHLQKEEQTIGTGFLTIGAKTLNEGNPLLFSLNCADDQIEATCRAFLALTANCARCHDHKYDPIPAKDYYAMAGIFLSSRNLAGAETNVRNEHSEAFPLGPNGFQCIELIEAAKARSEIAMAEYLTLVKARNELRTELETQGLDWKKNPTAELTAAENKVQAQQQIVKELKSSIPDPPEFAMAVIEGMSEREAVAFNEFLKQETEEIAKMKKAGKKPTLPTPPRPTIRDSPLFELGQHDAPGDTVPRGVLSLFDYAADPIDKNESGRRQLAGWIADKRNPLTARVFVNRVWHHLFGRGLVSTTDNFGQLGSQPSHPELLDTLAVDFMETGWSTKKLIRRIMLSRTWCQSSAHRADFAKRDPDNMLLWRFQPHLLEGETIRDSILFVSGTLELKQLQGSQVAEISRQKADGRQREIGRRDFYDKDVSWDVSYRSVYLPMARGKLPDMLKVFDAADPNLVVGARKLTIVPTQALFLSNSRMVTDSSLKFSKRLFKISVGNRIEVLFRTVLGRRPTSNETKTIDDFVAAAGDNEKTWARVFHVLICSGEFRTVY